MPTRWETFPIKFEGGLVTNLGRIEQGIQAPGSATILQNFEPDVQGGYTRVLGYAKYSTTAVPGTGNVRGLVALSSSEALVERGGQFYFSSGGAWTSKLTLTSSAISKVRSETYNFTGVKKTVVVDGVNDPAYFDHNTKLMVYGASIPADVTGASIVRLFKNHLFYAKGRLLTFAVPYTETNFTSGSGAGTINVGDDITGLSVFREQLFIFCLNKIFRLEGSSVTDFVLQTVTDNTGCLDGDTIQEVGGDIMYLGPDGVRYLTGTERTNDFGLSRASEKIQKKLLDTVRESVSFSSITVAYKNQYRFFAYTESASVANAVGYLTTKYSNQTVEDVAWASLKGFKVFVIDKFQDNDSESILFSNETGYVYRMESGTSLDGANIEAIFETPYMPIADPKIRKTFYKHSLYARPTGEFGLTCNLKFDYATSSATAAPTFDIGSSSGTSTYGSAVYGTAVYGVTAEEQYYSNVVGSGFVVALRYYNNSTLPPFNLNFAILEFRQNERR